MKRFAMIVAAVVAFPGRDGSAMAGADEPPMEIGGFPFDPALIDANSPLGPSACRDWKSPRGAATEAGLKSHREPVDGIVARAGVDANILDGYVLRPADPTRHKP